MHGNTLSDSRESLRLEGTEDAYASAGIEKPSSPDFEYRRSFWPAVLASAAAHVMLLLVLCLIVTGGSSGLRTIEFSVAEQKPVVIDDMAMFDLSPTEIEEPEEEFELEEQDFKLPVDLTLPVEPEPDPVAEVQNKTSENVSIQTTTPASTTLAQPLSRAAMSIQKRVSQAGGKKGEVQFALAWKNVNDVDIHVIAPSGERISHMYKSSRCGGVLDVDMNVRGESKTPVENVRWLMNAPPGRYSILVNLFRVNRPPAGGRVYQGSEVQLLAQLGPESIVEKTIVNRNNQVAVFRFAYLPPEIMGPHREQMLQQFSQQQKDEEEVAQRLLTNAKEVKQSRMRDQLLNRMINMYPHSDAAIDAMRLLGGSITKNSL
ncbi:MAG: hypothetical protein AAF483_19720 [Planctomycetota bacterium]